MKEDSMRRTSHRILPLISIIFSLIILVSLVAFPLGCGTGTKATSTPPVSTDSVNVFNYAFVPANIIVKAGTTVTWTNKDTMIHTVISDSGVFGSGTLAQNAQFTYVFAKPGTYKYHCSVHQSKKGTVIVE